MTSCTMEIGFIRALPVGALGDNRTGMDQTMLIRLLPLCGLCRSSIPRNSKWFTRGPTLALGAIRISMDDPTAAPWQGAGWL
jgi:hypothetical protein